MVVPGYRHDLKGVGCKIYDKGTMLNSVSSNRYSLDGPDYSRARQWMQRYNGAKSYF